jgi:exosortase/archaeosortase family protein
MKKDRRASSASRPILAFLARCVLYWGIALVVVSRVGAIEEAGIDLTLRTLQLVFGVFGQSVARHGASLVALGTSVQIVSECSPHLPFLIYAAVILAFPATWRERLIGLALGAAVIHVFNTARIITLMAVLSRRTEWFDFMHVYLWQTGTILIVFLTFALWIRVLGRARKAARPA